MELKTEHSGKPQRYTFYPVFPDQKETITKALAIAREERGTQFDAVALDYICLFFLVHFKSFLDQEIPMLAEDHQHGRI
jgi:hypothetical protein